METDGLLENGILIVGGTEAIKLVINYFAKVFGMKSEPGTELAPAIALIVGACSHVYLYGYSPENVVYGTTLGLSVTGLYAAAMKFKPTTPV